MYLLSIVMAAIAPGISLLAYFYLKDRYDSEPIHLVIKLFILGALIVFPSMALQNVLLAEFGPLHEITFAFTISGGVEEFLKWFVLYHAIFRHDAFDEPYDGIVYSVAISLGFATLENIFYAVFNQMSISAMLVRALLPVSGHALFGVAMGFYLGKAKFDLVKRRSLMFAALFVPIFWHGLFDSILTMSQNWIWVMIPFMIFLWLRTMWNVERANDVSPLRVMKRDEKIKWG